MAACLEAEVHLGPTVSKFDEFTVSPAGEVLEPGSRGVGDSSSEVSTMVPESPAVAPEPVSPIAVASVGLSDVPRDDFALATVGLISPQSLVSVGLASSAVVSVSPAVEEAPSKTNRKSSTAKGLLRRGFLGSRNVSPSPALGVEEDSYIVPKLGLPTAWS